MKERKKDRNKGRWEKKERKEKKNIGGGMMVKTAGILGAKGKIWQRGNKDEIEEREILTKISKKKKVLKRRVEWKGKSGDEIEDDR